MNTLKVVIWYFSEIQVGVKMEIVRLSSKFQIVIPKNIREELKLETGQKLQIFELDNRIIIVPLKNIKTMRGILKGTDTTLKRCWFFRENYKKKWINCWMNGFLFLVRGSWFLVE